MSSWSIPGPASGSSTSNPKSSSSPEKYRCSCFKDKQPYITHIPLVIFYDKYQGVYNWLFLIIFMLDGGQCRTNLVLLQKMLYKWMTRWRLKVLQFKVTVELRSTCFIILKGLETRYIPVKFYCQWFTGSEEVFPDFWTSHAIWLLIKLGLDLLYIYKIIMFGKDLLWIVKVEKVGSIAKDIFQNKTLKRLNLSRNLVLCSTWLLIS